MRLIIQIIIAVLVAVHICISHFAITPVVECRVLARKHFSRSRLRKSEFEIKTNTTQNSDKKTNSATRVNLDISLNREKRVSILRLARDDELQNEREKME